MLGINLLAWKYRAAIKSIDGHAKRQPRHDPASPASLHDNELVAESHLTIFHDFENFAEIANFHLQHSPWTIEDRREHRIPVPFDDTFGRTYSIYYRDLDAGWLLVYPGSAVALDGRFSARCNVSLDFVQLLPYADVYRLLTYIVAVIADQPEGPWSKSASEVTLALTGHLWEVFRKPDVMHGFNIVTEGTYGVLMDLIRSPEHTNQIFRT